MIGLVMGLDPEHPNLPGAHGDPTDRIIVVRAMGRDIPIVTYDRRLRWHRYLRTIW